MGVAAGAASSIGLFSSLLCGNARALAAAAQLGFAPSFLGYVRKDGVPTCAVVFLAVAALALSNCRFEVVVGASATIAGLRQVMLFAILMRLRHVEPGLPRPFCIPVVSTFG